jgi:hypothetical protein
MERLGRDRQRNRGFFSGMLRGESNAWEGSKILTFLFRPRRVCSSLLHLRSAWKVSSAIYFALTEFSELLISAQTSKPQNLAALCNRG